LTPRLTLNYGARYESFGAPRNTSTATDGVLSVTGATARVVFPGVEEVYPADRNDWGARFGFSWDVRGRARTVLRGAYGIFYDRPFDNLWQNTRSNRFVQANFLLDGDRFNYLNSVQNVLTSFQGEPFDGNFPEILVLDANLRTAYVQSYLLGLQQRITGAWSLDAVGLGSQGRKLITTDVINRLGSRAGFGIGNESRLFQGANAAVDKIFDVNYRANQGASSYHGFALSARYRGARSQFHLSYTWSHSIDNQSEALAGDFFDLNFTRIASRVQGRQSAFTRQFDSSVDRASSDFDQRHNLVFYSIWFLPDAFRGSKANWIVRDWRISQLAAFRAGFPYSVIAAASYREGRPLILNNRADLVGSVPEIDTPATGGRQLLDRNAFRQPAVGEIGNTGRNAFSGPGQFNLDVSLARSISLPWLGESGRITFRADAYNLLNHTNLAPPDSILNSTTFGLARYGRRGRDSGFPAQAPFEESARQVQLILRVEF
jgi:hypothetical protein